MTAQAVDLSGSVEATVRLLAEPYEWRLRAVEHIDIDSATHCLRRRSLHCEPLRTLLGDLPGVADAAEALVVVPVASLPKGPLLDLDLKGPGDGAPLLLPRAAIAEREAAYVQLAAASAGLAVPGELLTLLTYVFGFAEGPWQSVRIGRSRAEALQLYVASGLGDRAPNPRTLERWIELSGASGSLLAPYADRRDTSSAAEEPLLVVPPLVAEDEVDSARVTAVLESYGAFLARLASEGSAGRLAATELMNVIADYGRYWDLMAYVRLPLDQPFVIKLAERRAMQITGVSNEVRQDVVLADARSNHVALRVTDPNTRISRRDAFDPAGTRLADLATTWTSTDQVHSFYASDFDRDYRAAVVFRLAVLRRLQLVPYVVSVLLVLLVAALIAEQPSELADLALVAGPTALAASVILVREPSTLGSRLRRTSSVALSLALAAVLLTCSLLYLVG